MPHTSRAPPERGGLAARGGGPERRRSKRALADRRASAPPLPLSARVPCAQGEAVIIERLGKFHRVLNPGLQCIIPLVDSPKQFVWRDDRLLADGSIHSDPVNVTRIDLREAVFKFPSQEVYTVDTVQMKVSGSAVACPGLHAFRTAPALPRPRHAPAAPAPRSSH